MGPTFEVSNDICYQAVLLHYLATIREVFCAIPREVYDCLRSTSLSTGAHHTYVEFVLYTALGAK